jgi:hypothetical protein
VARQFIKKQKEEEEEARQSNRRINEEIKRERAVILEVE